MRRRGISSIFFAMHHRQYAYGIGITQEIKNGYPDLRKNQ
jgi:hypothetical protein